MMSVVGLNVFMLETNPVLKFSLVLTCLLFCLTFRLVFIRAKAWC